MLLIIEPYKLSNFREPYLTYDITSVSVNETEEDYNYYESELYDLYSKAWLYGLNHTDEFKYDFYRGHIDDDP